MWGHTYLSPMNLVLHETSRQYDYVLLVKASFEKNLAIGCDGSCCSRNWARLRRCSSDLNLRLTYNDDEILFWVQIVGKVVAQFWLLAILTGPFGAKMSHPQCLGAFYKSVPTKITILHERFVLWKPFQTAQGNSNIGVRRLYLTRICGCRIF